MRLLRPPLTAQTASTSPPRRERATSRVQSRSRSVAFTKDLGLDFLPARANWIGELIARRLRCGKQNSFDRWKARIVQHLFQVVDEAGAFERCNATQLVGARALEKDVFDRNGIAARMKESATLHPA